MSNKQRLFTSQAKVLATVGTILVCVGSYILIKTTPAQAAATNLDALSYVRNAGTIQQSDSFIPVELRIASIGKNISLVKGFYSQSNTDWTLSDVEAQYIAYEQSKSFYIYGHNSTYIFGDLPQLQQGDQVSLVSLNNIVRKYAFTDKKTVTPYEVDVLNIQGKDPQLILQTCSGWYGQNRDVYYFVSVK